ncbi:MAG: hypothetical protein JNL05_00530 [Flavobacteriales bacterium]|nr:hypothetical protein [Flavobacteriales bacterium]
MDGSKLLEDYEYLGAQLYTDERLAIILEVPLLELRDELRAGRSDRARAILKGRLNRETAIRESILDMATRGSSPAQAMAMEMLKKLDS